MREEKSTYFTRNQKLAEVVVKNLKNRHFDAYNVPTGEDAVKKVIELMPEGSSVAWGGSTTLSEIGMYEAIYDSDKKYIINDRDAVSTPEEKRAMMLKAFDSDYYLMSTNAVSSDGELVNIDGNGNRVAAMIYGPRNVIVVVSINKVEKTLEQAIERAKNVAAPANSMRFNDTTPCTKSGLCHSCKLPESVCANIVVARLSKYPGRIKVIVVSEELGF